MGALEFMWAGGYTERYHTHRTLLRDTVGHHSFNVACTILHLRPDASAALLKAALLHDVAEHKVGDMPAPAKRAMGIREVFSAHEAKVMQEAGIAFPELMPEEDWVLEFADGIDGMRFSLQERRMGNLGIAEIFHAYCGYCASLLFGANTHPLRQRPTELQEPAQLCDYEVFKNLKGEWYDICK